MFNKISVEIIDKNEDSIIEMEVDLSAEQCEVDINETTSRS